jgi:hypothetical protein
MTRHRAILLAAVLVVAGACGGADGDAPETAERPEAQRPADDPAAAPGEGGEPAEGGVPAVLAFSAPTLDGGTLEGAELAGRPVVFWFWSPY